MDLEDAAAHRRGAEDGRHSLSLAGSVVHISAYPPRRFPSRGVWRDSWRWSRAEQRGAGIGRAARLARGRRRHPADDLVIGIGGVPVASVDDLRLDESWIGRPCVLRLLKGAKPYFAALMPVESRSR